MHPALRLLTRQELPRLDTDQASAPLQPGYIGSDARIVSPLVLVLHPSVVCDHAVLGGRTHLHGHSVVGGAIECVGYNSLVDTRLSGRGLWLDSDSYAIDFHNVSAERCILHGTDEHPWKLHSPTPITLKGLYCEDPHAKIACENGAARWVIHHRRDRTRQCFDVREEKTLAWDEMPAVVASYVAWLDTLWVGSCVFDVDYPPSTVHIQGCSAGLFHAQG